MLSPQLVVADVLDCSPSVAKLLLEMRVGCIGCSMNRFCTLEDLCARHGLDLDKVILELQEKVGQTSD